MTDPFRATYRELTAQESQCVQEVKAQASKLWQLLAPTASPQAAVSFNQRELALARTKLEECVMWATKAFTA